MIARELIKKKRDGKVLSKEEIEFIVNSYTSGRIPDYQVAALLMAIYFQGLNYKETLALTDVMLRSGEVVKIKVNGKIVDKHSTGGIGDKVSLIMAPVLAEMGFKAPLLAGRALGFTGGTIDKIESTGMKVELTDKEIIDVVNRFGFSISAQTKKIAPADRKMYALRDATSTVESIPLIVSSILSKKLAVNSEAIVFDVKVGSGAFMKTLEKAEELASGLVNVSKLYGRKAGALITEMSQPLGRYAGNAVEIKEAIDALSGNISNDLLEVTSSLIGVICELTGENSFQRGKSKSREVLLSGCAVNRFVEWIQYLGGTPAVKFAENRVKVPAKKTGYISHISGEKLGYLLIEMGGGRKTTEGIIDYSVGLKFYKKIGDFIKEGETIGELICNGGKVDEFVEKFRSAFKIGKKNVPKPQMIKKKL